MEDARTCELRASVIADVNAALASGSRRTILNLAGELDADLSPLRSGIE